MIDIVSFVLPLGFLVFGFVWTAAFITLVVRRRSFLTRALETTGTVIDVEVRHYRPKTSGSTGSTHHYPTVRFQTADGRATECKINVSLHDFYEVGQTVIVNYDPNEPCKRTQLGERRSQPVGSYLLFVGVGMVIFVIGVVMTTFRFLL